MKPNQINIPLSHDDGGIRNVTVDYSEKDNCIWWLLPSIPEGCVEWELEISNAIREETGYEEVEYVCLLRMGQNHKHQGWTIEHERDAHAHKIGHWYCYYQDERIYWAASMCHAVNEIDEIIFRKNRVTP